ncbi:hypothetical protein G6F56_010842 [Rhizopus delemar]|nr:hypothetical protein G6F56_010842 [Rhizopus delemar]
MGNSSTSFFVKQLCQLTDFAQQKDVAVDLAKQFMARNLFYGSPFLVKVKQTNGTDRLLLSEIGFAIKNLKEEYQSFESFVMTKRENSNNNEYVANNSVLKEGTSGLFSCSGEVPFFGMISKIEKNGKDTGF